MQSGLKLTSLIALMAWGCSTSKPPKEFVYLETTPVRVTELHFDPSPDQGKAEFIEVTNVSKEALDLSGWQVTGAGRIGLPAGTKLAPGQTFVFCQDSIAFREAFGSTVRPTSELPGKLRNKGETVRIEDPQGRVADEAGYDPSDPEVAKAAGTGQSLHRVRLTETDAAGLWRTAEPTPGDPRSKR